MDGSSPVTSTDARRYSDKRDYSKYRRSVPDHSNDFPPALMSSSPQEEKPNPFTEAEGDSAIKPVASPPSPGASGAHQSQGASGARQSQDYFDSKARRASNVTDTFIRTVEQLKSSGTMYPTILSSPETLSVHVLDKAAPVLYIHTAMYHLFEFKMPIVDDTITFPTISIDATSMVLRYCYNNAKLASQDLEGLPIGTVTELYLLASRLKLTQFAYCALNVLEAKLDDADIAELCEYTVAKIRLDLEEIPDFWADMIPAPIEVWMDNCKCYNSSYLSVIVECMLIRV